MAKYEMAPYLGVGEVKRVEVSEVRKNLPGSPAQFFSRNIRIETETGPILLSLQAASEDNLKFHGE